MNIQKLLYLLFQVWCVVVLVGCIFMSVAGCVILLVSMGSNILAYLGGTAIVAGIITLGMIYAGRKSVGVSDA